MSTTRPKKALYGLLAGNLISIGGVAYLRSPSPIIGTFLFSIGLMAICLFNLNLFTGKVSNIVKVPSEEVLPSIMDLLLMWFENFFGCWITVVLLRATRYAHQLEAAAAELVAPKIIDGPMGLFILGLLCNILIYTATRGYRNDNRLAGSIAVVLSVMVFITCGFEHSIADAFYMIMARSSFYERASVLFPVALGNSVGGILPALILDR